MKYITAFLLLLLMASCQRNAKPLEECSRIHLEEFQAILDSAEVQGALLIYDPAGDGILYSNDFKYAAHGSLPASTYKIPHSIIALETGVVENEQTLFPWDGQERKLDIWEQDLQFWEAFQYSCVPCYQEIATKIGVQRMNEYLKKLNYGHMLVKDSSLQTFWLEGVSQINQFEQIDFLIRFYKQQLPISDSTYSIMKKLMLIEGNSHFQLYGKTGWAIRNGQNKGWFVGYLETNNQVLYFATRVEPNEKFNMEMFPIIRQEITMRALQTMGILTN
jgi:beta-lactamase class D